MDVPGSPLVVGHRGASAYLPEHTLAAYQLAIEMGADLIEPDLVSTRDGVLVARHENEIGTSTDVAGRSAFADRRTSRTVDGRAVSGWFVEDFTLAELRSLRAVERLPHLRPANTHHDGAFAVPTFAEVLELARAESARRGRTIGVYPETKHSAHFAALGLPLEPALLDELGRVGWDQRSSPVLVQSFDPVSLRRMRGRTGARLVQLVGAAGSAPDLLTAAGLSWIAGYADAVGVHRGSCTAGLVERAHRQGLLVHAWTLRPENVFLPPGHRRGPDRAGTGDTLADHTDVLDLGVDGVFTDVPDVAVQARRDWELRRAA